MKNNVAQIAFALSLAALLGFSFAEPTPITAESLRINILDRMFDAYAPEDDSSLFFLAKNEENIMAKQFASPFCYGPSTIPEIFYYGLDTTYYSDYASEVASRFKALFGADIVKSKVVTAKKYIDGSDRNATWNHFNGAAIKAAFDKMYQKPSESFHGIVLQKIYNRSMKKYVRDHTNVLIKVLSNKPLLESYAKELTTGTMTDPEFDGRNLAGLFVIKLKIKADEENYCLNVNKSVHLLLRRQCDGSLPALIMCLKTMLKDYDPEYYTKVAAKL
jgi:hypothetical protein